MKKFLTVIAASMMLAGAVSAQNLGGLLGSLGKSSDILGTVSKVVYAYTGNTNAVSLPGNWTYTGSAISLGGDNALSNVAVHHSCGRASHVSSCLCLLEIQH